MNCGFTVDGTVATSGFWLGLGSGAWLPAGPCAIEIDAVTIATATA